MDVSIASAAGSVEWRATENLARRPARKHFLVDTTALVSAGRSVLISAGSATGANWKPTHSILMPWFLRQTLLGKVIFKRYFGANVAIFYYRFVLLPDCKHTFEATALASWFEWQAQNVEALSCPKCETAVSLKLRRFRNSVLMAFDSWNKIRNRIEINKTCSARDLDDVLYAIRSCFSHSFKCKLLIMST